MNIKEFLTELNERDYLDLENEKEITLFYESIEKFVKEYKNKLDLKTLQIFNNNLNSKTFEELVKNNWFRETSITFIKIPNLVISIGKYAFRYCESLTSITISNSVTSIGEGAFCYCESLTSVNIPNSVTSIGDYAFFDCNWLTSLTIPNSVTSIGKYAFYNCESLTSITIPNSVTSIGYGVFSHCKSLKTIYLEKGIKEEVKQQLEEEYPYIEIIEK